jgi:single-strand DNA-binding protein
MNNVAIIGRLTRDPERRGGVAVKFGIAHNSKSKGEEVTDFFDVCCFDKTAERVEQYMTKGQLVGITGRLSQNNWEDREGNKRSSVEIIANQVDFLTPKGENPVKTEKSSEIPS